MFIFLNRIRTAVFFSIFIFVITSIGQAVEFKKLFVSENKRYLEFKDGAPFFYLGDTAWELVHRLDRDETDLYLSNRAEKGFTVIQTVVLAQLGGLDVPNANGDLPLIDADPAQPNVPYFKHVDYVVNRANELGMFVGLLPTWGSYWKQLGKNPPYIFNTENARIYGHFLGKRYRNANVIWILGGDENIRMDEERAVIEALAKGLREGDEGAHLITYHPRGPGQSSDFLHQADWLDFNMYQSSHAGRDHDNGLFAEHDLSLTPLKPTLDGEPRYECIPVGFYFQNADRLDRFDDYDARQAAYWSLLAGACGFTYGHNSVWQMWQPGRAPVIEADIPWYIAIDHPGSFQMKYVRRLFESRPFTLLLPAQWMIYDGPQRGGAKIRAALAQDSSFALIYSPRGAQFTVDRRAIKGNRVHEIWYNPRYGNALVVHTTDTAAFQTYTPPSSGRGKDWILILEDEAKKFLAIGN
ncbi:glycoside hydrolase family 140 protein [candidate division KSB1 bacterium]|nr:glycoside hydrolase family 140 protein [candidate division KSB1 bacterium]